MALYDVRKMERHIQSLGVLIVEDNPYMRKVIRNLLTTIGIKQIGEAADGIEGLELIRTTAPDVVLLDWEMPLLNGPELVRIVRSPGVFPSPDLPIIVVSAYSDRWRVLQAMRLGVNEYLVKPISAQTLYKRLLAIMNDPRPIVHTEDYYGPAPRRDLSELLDSREEPAADTAPPGES